MSYARKFATLTSVVAAALVSVLFIATPAYAEGEVDVNIDGLDDSMRAGGSSFDDFRATFINRSNGPISGVFAVVAVSLEGAPPESIHVQRVAGVDLPAQVTDDGTVVFADVSPFDLGRGGGNGRRRIDLFIGFGDGAPEGEAAVTVAAYAGGELLGSASASIEIAGAPTPTTTPPNTDPGIVPTFEAGPSYSIAPLTEAAAAAPTGGGVPTTVYVLGGLLVAMGVMTLVLTFWAPGRRFAADGGPEWAPQAAGGRTDRRRPMAWPRPSRSADGPVPPRPPQPGPLGSGGRQQWPVISRPGAPGHSAPHTGPATGTARPRPDSGPTPARSDPGPVRPRSDSGPATGTGRVIRDPRPDEGSWHYDPT